MFLLIFLISIGFGWYARKFGFATMWIALFNAVISIYLGIMLIPTIVAYIPAFASVYAKVMSGFGISIILFVFSQYIVVMTFDNALNVTLPDIFSKIASCASGFLLAMVLLNFFLFNLLAMLAVSKPDSGLVNSPSAEKAYSITHTACCMIQRLTAQPDIDMPDKAIKWYVSKPTKKKVEEEDIDLKEFDSLTKDGYVELL